MAGCPFLDRQSSLLAQKRSRQMSADRKSDVTTNHAVHQWEHQDTGAGLIAAAACDHLLALYVSSPSEDADIVSNGHLA